MNCAEIVNTTKSELLGCCIINMVLLQPAGEKCDQVKLSGRCCMQFIKLVLDVGRSGPGFQALGLNVQIGPERPE